ncbi:MAG: folate family ECF transporter S component [Pseudobutyrivibrio sp.]|nr:folate family ECF transporter S component [Pseudobutyrivibrio sp.]
MSQLKNTRVLTICALILALSAILGMFKIPITSLIEIRLGSLPLAVAGSLFGPVIGGIIGGLSDILAFIVKPTGPFFPGFTLSTVLTGIIFGLILKPKNNRVSFFKVLLAQLLNAVFVGLIFNTLNLYILYGDPATGGISGYFAFMLTRLPMEVIMYPINCLLITAIIKEVYLIKNKANFTN